MILIDRHVCRIPKIKDAHLENLFDLPDISDLAAVQDYSKAYALTWGKPISGVRHGVMETGFFKDAVHIDTVGLFQFCSLNTRLAEKQIESFAAPVSFLDFQEMIRPKFKQDAGLGVGSWDGVILPLQYPNDYSIRSGASPTAYLEFLEGACKYYGKDLLLKKHPFMEEHQYEVNFKPWKEEFEKIALKYKVEMLLTDHQVLSNCNFVLVYNSTFVVDAFLNGASVAQFAPGYFWQVHPVDYTAFTYPHSVNENIDAGYQFCSFLLWRYCFNYKMSMEDWRELLLAFSKSKELFPLPEKFSYARFILENRC